MRAHDPVGQRAILHLVPPVAIDADCLNVNSAPIHFPYAFGSHGAPATLIGPLGPGNNWTDCGDGDVGVNIHDADAASSDLHDAALHRTGGRLHHRSLPQPGISNTTAPLSSCCRWGCTASAASLRAEKLGARHQRYSCNPRYGLNEIPAVPHGPSLRTPKFANALSGRVCRRYGPSAA